MSDAEIRRLQEAFARREARKAAGKMLPAPSQLIAMNSPEKLEALKAAQRLNNSPLATNVACIQRTLLFAAGGGRSNSCTGSGRREEEEGDEKGTQSDSVLEVKEEEVNPFHCFIKTLHHAHVCIQWRECLFGFESSGDVWRAVATQLDRIDYERYQAPIDQELNFEQQARMRDEIRQEQEKRLMVHRQGDAFPRPQLSAIVTKYAKQSVSLEEAAQVNAVRTYTGQLSTGAAAAALCGDFTSASQEQRPGDDTTSRGLRPVFKGGSTRAAVFLAVMKAGATELFQLLLRIKFWDVLSPSVVSCLPESAVRFLSAQATMNSWFSATSAEFYLVQKAFMASSPRTPLQAAGIEELLVQCVYFSQPALLDILIDEYLVQRRQRRLEKEQRKELLIYSAAAAATTSKRDERNDKQQQQMTKTNSARDPDNIGTALAHSALLAAYDGNAECLRVVMEQFWKLQLSSSALDEEEGEEENDDRRRGGQRTSLHISSYVRCAYSDGSIDRWYQWSPLHVAVIMRRRECIKLLLANATRFDCNELCDLRFGTPGTQIMASALTLACVSSCPQAPNVGGFRIEDVAVREKNPLAVVRLLCDHPAVDKNGGVLKKMTAAIRDDDDDAADESIVTVVVAPAVAAVEMCTDGGFRIEHAMATLRVLLESGADINAPCVSPVLHNLNVSWRIFFQQQEQQQQRCLTASAQPLQFPFVNTVLLHAAHNYGVMRTQQRTTPGFVAGFMPDHPLLCHILVVAAETIDPLASVWLPVADFPPATTTTTTAAAAAGGGEGGEGNASASSSLLGPGGTTLFDALLVAITIANGSIASRILRVAIAQKEKQLRRKPGGGCRGGGQDDDDVVDGGDPAHQRVNQWLVTYLFKEKVYAVEALDDDAQAGNKPMELVSRYKLAELADATITRQTRRLIVRNQRPMQELAAKNAIDKILVSRGIDVKKCVQS